MYYQPFHEIFPEIAQEETRTITVFNSSDLPAGEYGLTEAYCNKPGCDCRRVFLNVVDWRTGQVLAVITYGWENRAYYVEWFGKDDPDIIEELQGPALNSMSRQSDLAPALLQAVKYVLQDRNYLSRIKRHYRMFKEAVDNDVVEESRTPAITTRRKTGRNAPCPCGSGKKYKNCCGK
jgi:hypothetical protein